MSRTQKIKPRFRVGDWVSFPYGAMTPVARIIEDRGRIGYGGRQAYQIEIHAPDYEPDRFEVAEDTMTPASPPKSATKAL